MTRRWLLIAVTAAIVLGIAFRLEHAQRRIFWQDETWSALRVSGHTYAELKRLFDDRLHSTSAVLHFQRYDARRGLGDTVEGLASEEPQHTPLFYAIDWLWARSFGSSVASLRAPSVVFGLLAIAAFAWFCWELTCNRSVAAGGAGLMALSPFFVDYSGQAREYALWATMVAVSCAILLRTLRTNDAAGWVWYSIAMTAGLYADLLMVCVLFAHACYVAILYRHDRKVVIRFGTSALAAPTLFAPWIAVCLKHVRTIAVEQSWAFNPYPLRLDIEKWIFNAGTVLFDAEYVDMRLAIVAGALLLLTFYAVFRLFRDESRQVRWFVGTLGGAIAAQQILTDAVTHGHESTTARYLLPLWMALLAALALFFGRRTSRLPMFVAILALSGYSCAVNSSAVAWWDNNDNTPSTTMAQRINASGPSPLVLSEGHWAEVLVMSHYVRSGTHFLLFKHRPPLRLPLPSAPSFLVMPSARTISLFRRRSGYDLVPIPIAPLTSQAVLSFHQGVKAAQLGLKNRVQWQSEPFLFRLEPRLAQR